MNKKSFNRVMAFLFIIGLISFVLFFLNGYFENKKADEDFIKDKYCGIINDIQYIRANRGLPSIKLDSKWHNFDLNEEKVSNYIKIGDSIVKNEGTDIIIVYRKDSKGVWNERIFK